MNEDIAVIERKSYTDSGKGWNKKTTRYLLGISKKCITYRNIHEQSAIMYEKRAKYFSLILILLSFTATVYTFFLVRFQEVFIYDIFLKILNISVSTLVTITNFLEYQQLAAKHRIGSQQFLDLNKSISEELLTDEKERIDCIRYIKWVGNSFAQIRKGLPYPPQHIIVKYDKSHDIEKGNLLPKLFSKNKKVQETIAVDEDLNDNIELDLQSTIESERSGNGNGNNGGNGNGEGSSSRRVDDDTSNLNQQNYELSRMEFVT